MEEQGFKYEDEELDEIDYFEIVSLDEIIKNNPVFVAFSQEELYDYFFNFFKSKKKAEGFLNLFNEFVVIIFHLAFPMNSCRVVALL